MKKIILFIALMQSTLSFCQDTLQYDNDGFIIRNQGTKKLPKHLLEKDTIYILFEHKKNQECIYCDASINKPIKKKEAYRFSFPFGEIYRLSYYDFLDQNGKIELTTIYYKKSFLRKNKDIILTYDEILDYGPINILNAFANKKVFVIDKKEIKNRKIIARQVNFWSNMFQE